MILTCVCLASDPYWGATATGWTGRTKVAVRGGEGDDVVGLGLRLNDQLDACALLQRRGEVALLAKCNDVVVKGLKVAVVAGYSLMLPPSTTLCHRSLRLQGRR
jgi:hypothetical protein